MVELTNEKRTHIPLVFPKFLHSVGARFVGFLPYFSSASGTTDIFPLKKKDFLDWTQSGYINRYGFSKSIRV